MWRLAPGVVVPVLVNPRAGWEADGEAADAIAALAAAGLRPELRRVAPAAMPAAIRRLVDGGVSVVAVAGGDGTISTAAAALVGTHTAIAPIPTGTRNHFARRFGIDGPEAAARAIAAGATVPCAVGTVNGRVFINNASCGLYPHLVRHRERLRPRLRKWGATAAGAAVALRRLPMLDVTLSVAGCRLRRRAPVVWVGIGRGSFRLPEGGQTFARARLLEVVVVRPVTRRRLALLSARALLRVMRGRQPIRAPGLEVLHAPGLVLDSDRPVDCALDGEAFRLDPPLRFSLWDRALRVVAAVDDGWGEARRSGDRGGRRAG